MANTIGKNAQGYGYKYTDLAHIHEWLEANNFSYYQYIEADNGIDYVMTVKIIDGEEKPPLRGCRVVQATLSGKSNAAQEQGSALTYARRYSLLMAFGLATDDDDGEALTKKKKAPEEDKRSGKEFKPAPKKEDKKEFKAPAYDPGADYRGASNNVGVRLKLDNAEIVALLAEEQQKAFTFDNSMTNEQWYAVYCALKKEENNRA